MSPPLVRIREAGVAVSKTFKAKKEAEKFIRDIKTKLDRGESVDGQGQEKMALGTIFDDYIKHNTLAKGSSTRSTSSRLRLAQCLSKLSRAGTFAIYLKTKLEAPIPDQTKKKKAHPLFKGNMVKKDESSGEMVKDCRGHGSQNLLCDQECFGVALQAHGLHL